MSVQKHRRTNSKAQLGLKEEGDFIYEHVRRIDGQQVMKKYLKCGLLGKGGFANCYITENVQTKKRAATKIVMKEELKSHRTKLRLINEIRLHKTLHHENVVQLQHHFEDKDNVYIFLELCSNQSLNELIRVRTYFLTPEIQSFLYGIIQGVRYIHSKQIIHRDLKLGNIFIDEKLNIKIGDFGLATKLEFNKENKRTVCGTPNYIAPEILEGKGYHYQVDIWSIGVILYTLFYSTPPFETEDANSTYQRIRDCNYTIPKISPVPQEAVNLIQKILVRNPADRPTLQQLLDSDFMKLGNGILKQLPKICAKKAPTKKQLSVNNTLIASSKDIKKKDSIQIQDANPKDYIIDLEQLQENRFYFRMVNDFSGILELNNEVVYAIGGQFLRLKLKTGEEEKVVESSLKYLLLGKEKRFNVLDQTNHEAKLMDCTLASYQRPIVAMNIQICEDCTLVRLSNNSIQLIYTQISYLITESKVFEIFGKRIKQIDIILLSKVAKDVKKNEQMNKVKKVLIELKKVKQDREEELNEAK